MNSKPNELSERGWVYMGDDGNVYRVCRWVGDAWLMQWHKEHHWVSIRRINADYVDKMPRNLSEAEQQRYFDLEAAATARLLAHFSGKG